MTKIIFLRLSLKNIIELSTWGENKEITIGKLHLNMEGNGFRQAFQKSVD